MLPPDDVAELARFRREQQAAAGRAAAATPVVKPATTTYNPLSGMTVTEQRMFGQNSALANSPSQFVPAKSGTDTPPGPGILTQADLDKALEKALAANNASWQTKLDALTAKQNQSNRDNTTTALQDFTASLTAAGLGTLASSVSNMILQDKTASQIRIDIVNEPAYKARFPGMDALAKAGKAVNEATYISMERGMISVLKAYGLDDKVLGTTEKLGTVIANQVSVTEYENRVQLAADHVKKNPDVLAALNEYYGVDLAGAMSTILDPKVGMDIVRKQVRAAEIGAAAEMYQFNLDKAQAESYINVSGATDLNALKQSFGKARTLATTQSRLTGIEGGKYDELESVATILGQDQERLLESQRRALREQARFAGQSGVSSASLKRESTI